MQPFAGKNFADIRWGIAASVALHLALALLLLVRLPELSPPSPEQTVNVELVPPQKPETPPKAEPSKAAPPKPSQQAFESASAKVEKETPPREELPPAAPDKAETPRDSSPTPPPVPAQTENAAREEPVKTEPAPAELHAQTAATQAEAETPTLTLQNPPVPQDKPAKAQARQQADRLTRAQTIYSKDALSSPHVRQALGRLPPKDRIVQICGIEALEQIRRHKPGAFPDMLARTGGFVSDSGQTVSDGAFRSQGQWYAVDFKCEVDVKTMAIAAFSYAIGSAIPESEWSGRQLPRD